MVNNKIFDTIKHFINEINRLSIFIGVDGGQGSGKSYFITELKEDLANYNDYNIIDIEADDFLIDRDKRNNLPASFFKSTENISRLFDFERMAEVLLLLQKNNETIEINNLYNTQTGKKDRVKHYNLKEKNIVLVGGPYLLSPLFLKFDLMIFLDVKEENRLTNTLKRTINKTRTIESQKELFNNFESFYKPYYSDRLSTYDMVIDNNDFDNREIIKNII